MPRGLVGSCRRMLGAYTEHKKIEKPTLLDRIPVFSSANGFLYKFLSLETSICSKKREYLYYSIIFTIIRTTWSKFRIFFAFLRFSWNPSLQYSHQV